MPLDYADLKAKIAANTNTIPAGQPWTGSFAGAQVKDVPNSPDGNAAVAGWYNLATAYLVWKTDADKALVDGQIAKASFTPSDAAPASGSTAQVTNDQLLFQNRALVCQLKQFNAQWLTAGAGTINASLSSVRQNFNDCLTQIPSGAGGANQNAGWGTAGAPGAVRLALTRTANNIEKAYAVAATGPGNAGGDARGGGTNPDALVYEGTLTPSDVLSAKNS